jgi:hypothetical protein
MTYMPPTVAVPAGWYADPDNAAAQRWWDGTQWTSHTQLIATPVPDFTGPADAPRLASSVPSALPMPAPTYGFQHESSSAYLPHAGQTGRPTGTHRPPWPVMAAAAVMGLHAVLSSLLLLAAGGFGSYQAGGVVGSMLAALMAYLLWKGRRGAYVLTLIFGTLGIVGRLLTGDLLGAAVAAAVVLLLVTSESARGWFR